MWVEKIFYFLSLAGALDNTTRFAVEELFSYKSQNTRKRRIFLFPRATYKGTYVEAVESAKEGEKVAPAKARFLVPYTKNIFFWFTSIWVLRYPSRLNIGSYET